MSGNTVTSDPMKKIKKELAKCYNVDPDHIYIEDRYVYGLKMTHAFILNDDAEPFNALSGAFISSYVENEKKIYIVSIRFYDKASIKKFSDDQESINFTQEFIIKLYIKNDEINIIKSSFEGTVGKEPGIAYVRVTKDKELLIGFMPEFKNIIFDIITELIKDPYGEKVKKR